MKVDRLTKAFADNQPRTPLTEEESVTLMHILLGSDMNLSKTVEEVDKESEFYKHFEPLLKSFQAQVFLKRLEMLTTHKITVGALILIMQHIKNPAQIVMYVYYINSKLAPNTLIDVNVFSMDLFPWGVFSDEQLNTIWSIQKVRAKDGLDKCHCHGAPDNLLDYNEIWEK